MHDDERRKPGYAALRRHRWSAAGAEYFVATILRRPAEGLTEPRLLEQLETQRDRLEADRVWRVRSWVVMPDHVHLVISLGGEITLQESIRLFKGRLSSSLRNRNLQWQDGFHEHRLRADEDRLPVFQYLFLNPYRARLIATSEIWPGYYCSPDDWTWFEPLTNSKAPFPEWIK